MRQLDYPKVLESISAFIRDYAASSGFEKYILGISGGIDSALSAALAVHAMGAENVIGIMMPHSISNANSLKDGLTLCESLGIAHQIIDISPICDPWFQREQPEPDFLRKGNFMARVRMCILYDLSSKYKALVLGTGNLSEIMTGYFTQFGDAACAIEPLGQLYKTEVYELAKYMKLPQAILDKVPSADLWAGQSDEAELGISYPDLDKILYAIQYMQDTDALDAEQVKLVYKLISRSQYKRILPLVPEPPC